MNDVPYIPPFRAEDLYDDDNYLAVPQDAAGLKVGEKPTAHGSTGTWGDAYDPGTKWVLDLFNFKGDLYACGDSYIMRRRGGAWSIVYTNADYVFHTLCELNGMLYVGIEDTVSVVTMRVFCSETGNLGDWAQACAITKPDTTKVFKLYNDNGIMYAGLYQYGIMSTADGTSWSSAGATTGTFRDIFKHNGDLYATTFTSKQVKKYDGSATWSVVYTSANNLYCGTSYNGKAVVSASNGAVAYSTDGATWAEATVVSTTYEGYRFMEWDGILLVAFYGKVYQSTDALNWTAFYDFTETYSFCLLEYEGLLYCGCGCALTASTTQGIIHVRTDATYDPAPPIIANGEIQANDAMRLNGTVGAAGAIPMSNGMAPMVWLGPGTTGQYAAAVTGGLAVMQAIPASDVVNTPAGGIEAITVQAAIDELDTEKAAIAATCKLTTKTDTGDPVSATEGEVCINTFDNSVKIFADGSWRSLATW